MSTGVDLDNLGPPITTTDDGSVYTNPNADLKNSLPSVIGSQDQGSAQLSNTTDFRDTLGTQALTGQDQGQAFPSLIVDAAALGLQGLTPQDTTDAWWQMRGFDTVALTVITWQGRSPLTPPPTQNPVSNISAVRLIAFLPQTNGL